MRPPDENQHGSTRPNLLSGARRRFAGDDNLLARLERDSARQASGNRSRAAWYAAAASLVLLLIVVLAWMAYENVNTVRVIPVAQAPTASRARDTGASWLAASASEPVPSAAPAAVQLAQAPPAMLSVPTQRSVLAVPPPLVLLQADQAAPKKPSASLAAQTPALRAPTVSEARTSEAGVPVERAPVAPAQLVQTPVLRPPAVRAAAVARASPPAALKVTLPRSASRLTVPARTRKTAAPAAASDAHVDSDVALLSAIIIHDSAHAGEKAQLDAALANCSRAAEKRCASRLPGSL